MTTTQTPRRRDAAATRQLLLDAAVHRFTHHGYAATTVRHIADDAGVNVALISRYFRSKEGLFEACLTYSVDELNRSTEIDPPIRTAEAIARQVVGPCTRGVPHNLVLLLRTSGDEGADRIRLDLLRSYSQRLAAAAGHTGDAGLLRAQVMIAAAAGIALMRAKTDMEPLASAGEADLLVPLCDMIESLLFP
ncbi:TetR/AcrR family transcriptional regulator [Actinoplanes derwentensis]|uniref:DNA-binding transcriptional regulator, AcrR family n=1 Tax=Actinoplanes derwentensis TaxID=113562 RepID=A0A1H2BG52_9ACTN|nr:TetR family transcriptional regulator [Actinoplanes derwentensis]GID87792.1 TetR family transcriptional regulator [Actinoplanes derwentensis]SDT57221.1 DNA-binding transcriptional regulator, AcrR family [Actinoplanes derwentensis]